MIKLWDYIAANMSVHKEQLICEGKEKITFQEVILCAELVGRMLKGVKSCAIICESELAAGIAILGCFASEVTAIPISYRYGQSHCKRILDAVDPEAIITYEDGEFKINIVKKSKYIPPVQHPALIMCTSGTTGKPKCVMLSEKNIITNVRDILKYFNITKEDEILISRPLYHCAVLTGEFLVSLIRGLKIRFYSGAFNPALILEELQEHKSTVFCGTPTLLNMISKLKRTENADYVKHICVSGECMDFETGQRIARAFPEAEIYHVYGQTEASPRISYLPPKFFEDNADCVGIPLENVKLKIISDSGTEAEINEVGTLWIQGYNTMIGYYNDSTLTAKVIVDDWLCTGDLAYINEKGLLKIIGRKDDMIIKAGMNIYPQEIESIMKQDAKVLEICVYGIKDDKLGVQIIMDIAGDFDDVSSVKKLCRELLSSYQLPNKINLYDEIPKNGFGKIVRRR